MLTAGWMLLYESEQMQSLEAVLKSACWRGSRPIRHGELSHRGKRGWLLRQFS